MVPVFVFAVGGILVAGNDPAFSAHTWFPSALGALSGFLALKVWLRLRARTRHE